MCFSLPTPDNPFNDKHDPKKDLSAKQRNPNPPKSVKSPDMIKPPAAVRKTGVNCGAPRGIHGCTDGPSKFLTLCLNFIQKSLLDKSSEHHLLLNKWGAEFLACSLLGTDILETTGDCSSVEQIAWMVSIASDIIAVKEKEGLSVPNPFLLILVPSKEKAIQVCMFML